MTIVFVSDPLCEVQPEGQNVTLTCRMTYDWQAPARQFNAVPALNVSLSWTGVSGTTVRTTADPATFRGTVETNMTVENVISGTIPSYSCSIQFDFSPGHSPSYQYAVNSVSYTCVTQPTQGRSKSNFTIIILKVFIRRTNICFNGKGLMWMPLPVAILGKIFELALTLKMTFDL